MLYACQYRADDYDYDWVFFVRNDVGHVSPFRCLAPLAPFVDSECWRKYCPLFPESKGEWGIEWLDVGFGLQRPFADDRGYRA